MRAGLWSWPSWRSPRGLRAAGFCLLVLLCWLVTLCLPISLLYGQNSPPTSPLGADDYLSFKADLEIVRAQLESGESALRQARDVSASISEELRKAREELASYKDSSMQSYQDLSQRVEMLEQQLKDSSASVSELRSNLVSKQAEYDEALKAAAAKAGKLECGFKSWRVVGIAGIVAAIIATIVALLR